MQMEKVQNDTVNKCSKYNEVELSNRMWHNFHRVSQQTHLYMHKTNTNMKLKLNQSEFKVAKQLAGNSDLHFALSNGCVLLVIRVG